MTNIDIWLKSFRQKWKLKEINSIINLFAKNVEYWESPFTKITSIKKLKKEWLNIHHQHKIVIKTKAFSSQDNNHTVLWDLRYQDTSSQKHHFKGVYLISLNTANRCTYFLQISDKVNER